MLTATQQQLLTTGRTADKLCKHKIWFIISLHQISDLLHQRVPSVIHCSDVILWPVSSCSINIRLKQTHAARRKRTNRYFRVKGRLIFISAKLKFAGLGSCQLSWPTGVPTVPEDLLIYWISAHPVTLITHINGPCTNISRGHLLNSLISFSGVWKTLRKTCRVRFVRHAPLEP